MRIVAIALLCLLFCSCGTIMGAGPKNVPIDSEPKGATVYYQGVPMGKTPCVVPVRKMSLDLVLRLDGYHEQVAQVGKSGNGWIVGNILFGGVPGLLIDLFAGGTWVVSDHPLVVPLVTSDQPAPGPWKRPAPPSGRIGQQSQNTSPGDAWQQ